jgi:hypothetical protein
MARMVVLVACYSTCLGGYTQPTTGLPESLRTARLLHVAVADHRHQPAATGPRASCRLSLVFV